MNLATNNRNLNLEIFLVCIVFIATSFLSITFQKPISINGGQGFDGVDYYKMATDFSEKRLIEAKGPYVYRIGTPFLASLIFKDNLLLSFKIVNIIGAFIILLLLIVWFRLYISNWKIRTFLIILFITQWHAPTRFVHFYPAYTDPWALVMVLAGMIGIHKVKMKPTFIMILGLSLIAFVGVIFREIVILVPIALLFSMNPIIFKNNSIFSARIAEKTPGIFYIPLVFSLMGLAAIHFLVSQTNDYSFVHTALSWAYRKPLLTYILAWFIAFGPIIIILVHFWKQTFTFLINHQSQLIFVVSIALLGWIGGSDTDRILYWSMPIIYLLIGIALENSTSVMLSRLFIVVLGSAQLISQRLLWSIPDFKTYSSHSLPIFTPLGSNTSYLDLSPLNGSRIIAGISLIQYLLFAFVLLVWLNHRSSPQVNELRK